jgi:hypothetical protein
MVEKGTPHKTLQERLGHSLIRTLPDIYGFVMATLESDGSDLDDLITRPSRGTYVARGSSAVHPM